MWTLWSRISYIVQILAACMLFVIPARKKLNFKLRIISGIFLFLAVGYALDYFHELLPHGEFSLGYWMLYMIGAVLFIRIVLETNWTGAVYCGICSCCIQHIAFDFYVVLQLLTGKNNMIPDGSFSVLSLLVYMVVYAFSYCFFTGKLVDHGKFAVKKDTLITHTTIIIIVWVISVIEMSSVYGFEAGIYSHIIYRAMDALCCFYALWVQIHIKERMSLQRELDGINAAAMQQQYQYKITSETIDSINRKCHDLKHQIRALREFTNERDVQEYLNDIENDVMIYDTAIKTGNRALDIILMEKGLFCKDHNIQWSCMVDGKMLEFMRLEDIYAIFGNALDNAVTAVLNLKDEEKRVISVKVLEQNQLLMIQIQNYYDSQLTFEKGLPKTTQKDKNSHGYGMKSIQYTAEKYNGIITVQTKNNIFMLQVLIPVKEKT